MTKKEEESQRKVAEALALIVTSQPRDEWTKAAADHQERISK